MDMATNLHIKILKQNFSETPSVSSSDVRKEGTKEGRFTTQKLNVTDNVHIIAMLMDPMTIGRTPLTGDRPVFEASTCTHVIIFIC